ncbi:uncharacterized protein LOC134793913 [Cydia splendana]|uniref:uncharacterized protein LOC134793913 n=1 Tax=Cydia splendana TaxID=1100963 RepID=UPI00300DB218
MDGHENWLPPGDHADHAHSGTSPTAAVGSQSPILGGRRRSVIQPEPTFTMDQVMSLVTTVTKQAAASAVNAALSATAANPQQPALPRERGNFYLPPFDPDVRSHDIRDWCANVDETISVFSISPQEARMKAILQLKGRAKVWADTWSLHSTTWDQVKEDIIKTFSKEFRYADDVQKWRNYTSDQAASYAEYATTAWTLFKRVRPEANDADAVDAVITGIYPEHIRSELLRSTPDSLPKLVSVLKTYRKRKFDTLEKMNNNNNSKKARPTEVGVKPDYSSTICYRCNKPGHRFRDCKALNSSGSDNSPTVGSESKAPTDTKSVECKYCKKKGHVEKNCFRKMLNERSNSDKLVNLCSNLSGRARSTTTVKIGDVTYPCLFDTGSDCSLMRKRFSGSIPGKRKAVNATFFGAGEHPFDSRQTITNTVEIGGTCVELEFYVVEDTEIQDDIIIGFDLLQIPGLSVTQTRDEISVKRNFLISKCTQKESCLEPVFDTDVKDTDLLKKLHDIVDKYKDSFTTGNRVSKVNTGELKIRLKNPDKIVQRRPYRLSPTEREKVKEMIADLKSNEIIRESSSPFSSPILLVKKKDGSDRLCVDFRELNANTLRDHFPLPLIADQIDKLGKARYFTRLDMTAGFHQIPIAEDSIEKTSFVTPDGQYEYLRMPFGLCNAPSVYQRAINKALGDYKDNIALVYLDDILIMSETPEEGKKCLPPAIKLLQVDDDEPIEDLTSVRNVCKQRMDERSFQDKLRFDIGKARVKPYKVGDFVLMRRHERHTTKLGAKFEGPMEILEILPNDRYKLKHVNLRGSTEKIASHDFLRPAPTGQTDPFDNDDDESAVWAVDETSSSVQNEDCSQSETQ